MDTGVSKEVLKPTDLFSINDRPVYPEEFLHVLKKSVPTDTKDSRLSEEEYEKNFELFVNYKLKVMEAERLEMDKSEEFEKEFSVFKEDIKKPYLIKNSLQEGELRKAYSRMQVMVKASHILLRFPNNASQSDSIAVLRMAEKLKNQAEEGADFRQLALEYSEDPSAQSNGGDLGYFTALQMVYPFEDAAYQLEPGQISGPILTDFGYHIIKVEDRKPNPGEIKVSHILVRTDEDPGSEIRAKRKIADIYIALRDENSTWEDITLNFSEDQGTRSSGGQLPWFGVGSIVPEFEKAAFSLTETGEISSPVKTSFGYHIIRLDDTRPLPSYEESEPALKSKILRDSRSGMIQSQVTAMQMAKYGYYENVDLIQSIKPLIEGHRTSGIETAKAKLEEENLLDSMLLLVSGERIPVKELILFIEKDEAIVRADPDNYFDPWFEKFTEYSLDKAEEKDLMTNNEEFRLLLQEFREGILLFSLMNDSVWQKAILDSAGQRAYYEKHIGRYQWSKRVPALILKMTKDEQTAKVRRYLSDKSYSKNLKPRLEDQFLNDYPLLFTLEEGLYEIQSHPILSKLELDKNNHEWIHEEKIHFLVTGEILPAGPKKFEETRGKVIQDYQQYLDSALLDQLREKYVVQINEDEKEKTFRIANNH